MELIAVTWWRFQETRQCLNEVTPKDDTPDFKEFLVSGPDLSGLEIIRSQDLPRPVELSG